MTALADKEGVPTPQEPLGKQLVKRGLITDEQLTVALDEQKSSGEPLGAILCALGFATPASVAQALATQHGGLLKTEYGFATGFGNGVKRSGAVGEPPVSSASIGREATEVDVAARPADLRADLERRLAQESQRVAALEEELAELRTPQDPEQDMTAWQTANTELKQALAEWQAGYAEIEQALAQWQAAYGELDRRLAQAWEHIASLQAEVAARDAAREEPAPRRRRVSLRSTMGR